MSSETEVKNEEKETQNKLLDDNNHGYDETDGTVTIDVPRLNKEEEENDEGHGPGIIVELIKRNKYSLAAYNLIVIAFQIAYLVIGTIFINDCPISRGVPIMLLVIGGVNMCMIILEKILNIRNPERNRYSYAQMPISLKCMVFISLACTIPWMVVVYKSTFPTFEDTNDENYCNKTLFLFSFWSLNMTLIWWSTTFCISFCFGSYEGFKEGYAKGKEFARANNFVQTPL